MNEMLQKSENVANENSQDLTDKWKKGELPSGWYYVRLIRGEYRIDLYINGKKEWIDCPDNIIDTVVCEVPSYDEIVKIEEEKRWYSENLHASTDKINELKDLLKECLAHLTIGKYGTSVTPINILCDEVEKALK